MFEKASRTKDFVFESVKGNLSVNDLWRLPLSSKTGAANLDDIARGLHKQLKNDDDVSFVVKDKKSDAIIQLKFDIVKHIIEVRLEEDSKREQAQVNAEKKQQILQALKGIEEKELEMSTPEELRAMLAKLV